MFMKMSQRLFRSVFALLCFTVAFVGGAVAKSDAGTPVAKLDKASCLKCHENKHDKIKVPIVIDGEEDERELRQIDTRKYAKSVHSNLQCVDCHRNIVDSQKNHQLDKSAAKADCITCHQDLWAKARQAGKDKPRLELVFKNIEAYKNSFHARENKDIPGTPLAKCDDCHSSHEFDVPPKGSERRTAWHKSIPETCGTRCHEDQLEIYATSVHGEEVIDKGNIKAAVCTDCHSAHSVTGTSSDAYKLANVQSCGNCHKEEIASFRDTYHGKVSTLGWAYTARCVSCHDSHGIKAVEDPKSKVHPNNRLKTCQSCHDGKKLPLATEGFATFAPHANAHDFAKYPQMYVVTKFMIWLLIGVFAFFWLHSALWYYREWRERKLFKTEAHVRTEGLDLPAGKHFERFALGWRIGHLVFAITTMALVLTGTTALFADSAWAPVVAKAFGGPQVLGYIHRIAAAIFIGIFFIHFIYVMQKLLRDKDFTWFGPDSLVPNWKDLDDMIGMFRWFFGKGPKPQFDRWTYFEKFDYWAVFWGVSVIGMSGLMLAFPHITAQYLPGWVFNVATVVHGEEAFLAAVFLFTVHFFNNHFRPNKLPPPDVVMFTGTQSLEEFRHEHPAQYQRLVESGELQKRLVDAPSRQVHVGSVILGLTLIAIGLTLLVMVINGMLGKIAGG
jgi:cytochrome b subunit of formate dehydrogenase